LYVALTCNIYIYMYMIICTQQTKTVIKYGQLPRVGVTTLLSSVCPMSENVGASISSNPKGLQGLYRDNFTQTDGQMDRHIRIHRHVTSQASLYFLKVSEVG
jgi:hypothetical protein